MIQKLVRLYEGESLSGVNLGVLFIPVEFDFEINKIKVKLEEMASADVVFVLTNSDNTEIAGSTVTIESGDDSAFVDGLAIARLEDADIYLKLVSGAVNSTITLTLTVDDSETATGVTAHSALTGLNADDHPQYFNQTRGDARYVQSSTLIETIQDTVGAMLSPGSHASIIYNDATGIVSIDSVQLTDEEIQDKVAALLSGGANTTVTYNDAGNVLTIAETTAGKTQEEIEDIVANLLAGGTNVTLTYNDAGNVLTIAASGGSGTTLPTQTGNGGKFLKTDGSTLSWDTPAGGATPTFYEITWMNVANNSINSSNQLTKTGSMADDGRASSVERIVADGAFQFTVNEVNSMSLGVCYVDTLNPLGASLDYGFDVSSSGTIRKLGVSTGVNIGAIIVGTVFEFRRTGTTFAIYKNGASIYADTCGTRPLHFKVCNWNPGKITSAPLIKT